MSERRLILVYHRKMSMRPFITFLVSFLVGIFVSCQFISLAGAVNSVAAVLEPSSSSMSIGQAAEYFDGVDFDHEEIVDPFLSMPHITLRTVMGDESKFQISFVESNSFLDTYRGSFFENCRAPGCEIALVPPETANDLWLRNGVLLI